jgi:hypothetical protein
VNETVLAGVIPAHLVAEAHAMATSGSGTYSIVSTCSWLGRVYDAMAPPTEPPPAATHLVALKQTTASGRSMDVL